MINQETSSTKMGTDFIDPAIVEEIEDQDTAVKSIEPDIIDDSGSTLTETLLGVLEALKSAGDGLESQFTSRWSRSTSETE